MMNCIQKAWHRRLLLHALISISLLMPLSCTTGNATRTLHAFMDPGFSVYMRSVFNTANSLMQAGSNENRPSTQAGINALQTTAPSAVSSTWDVKITGPNQISSGSCTYTFAATWTVCGASGGVGGYPVNGVYTVNGLNFNPTACTWNALYSPSSCVVPSPGYPLSSSFSLSPASGSGVQYVTLSLGSTSAMLKVEYVYNP